MKPRLVIAILLMLVTQTWAATLILNPAGVTQLAPNTVYDTFGPGVIDSEGAIRLNDNQKLIGAANSIIRKGPSNRGWAVRVAGNNVEFRNIRLEGAGIWIDRPGGPTDNITIDNNELVMEIVAGKEVRDCIRFSTYLTNSRITNNLITSSKDGQGRPKYLQSFAIYSHHGYRNLVIANNEVIDVYVGFHIDATNPSSGLLVEQNYIKGTRNQGMEFQTTRTVTSDNPIFQDNWYENPQLVDFSGRVVATGDCYAYSLPVDRGQNVIVRRNVAIAPKMNALPPGAYVRIMYELGGKNINVHDNYSWGGNSACAVNGFEATGHVYDNRFEAAAKIEGNNGANRAATLFERNGPTVNLSAEMQRRITVHDIPGRNRRYGQAAPIPPSIPVTVLSAPAEATILVPGKSITATGTGQNLRWEIDRENDAQPEIATGTGNSITFTVPADSTAAHTIRIRLIGDGGTVERRHAINVPSDELAQLRAQLAAKEAELAQAKIGSAAKDQAIAGLIAERDALKAKIDAARAALGN